MRLLLLHCAFTLLAISAAAQTPLSYPAMQGKAEYLGPIAPLRSLSHPDAAPEYPAAKMWSRPNRFFHNELSNPAPLPQTRDPLFSPKKKQGAPETEPEIKFIFGIEGLRDPNVTPPDPVGDVGEAHYVQAINANGGARLMIWDKEGAPALGPIHSSNIWAQVGGQSIGDPVVQYDHDAKRWLFMEMRGFGVNQLLVAISDSEDPTGSWQAWNINTMGFPDYPKLYVWPHAYLITVNEIIGSNRSAAYVLQRDAMLSGQSDIPMFRFEFPNFLGVNFQPSTGADWEGGPPPPPGSPGLLFRVYDDAWNGGTDQLQYWEVYPNWSNPELSQTVGPFSLFPTPFETKVCVGSGLFNCIEQPDPDAPRITALENIIMYRAPYRNFGDYEAVVLNHTADVSGIVGPGGIAAMRWYELRRYPGGDWQIWQEGTHAPDADNSRFMGTLSIDEAGNIGLGYSHAGKTQFPSLVLCGRRAGDPSGQISMAEYPLAPGLQSHYDQRWGDYSNMAVDPVDGRTFWFTGEYQPLSANWGTYIGSFTILRDTFDITPVSLLSPQTSALLGDSETVAVRFFNGGIESASGFAAALYLDGLLQSVESVPGMLGAGETLDFTFSKKIKLDEEGRTYQIMIVTQWGPDQFARNDTLRAAVTKRLSYDASIAGRADLPNQICGDAYRAGILIRNESGLDLQSLTLRYFINAQPPGLIQWSGLLSPDQSDTVWVDFQNLNNGINFFTAFVELPNGQQDQHTLNDTLFVKFNASTTGALLIAELETQVGVLNWELRNAATNQILATGEANKSVHEIRLCTNNNACYRLSLRSSTFNWAGSFRLLDIFGNVLAQANAASINAQNYDFCTPQRAQRDVGLWKLELPQSDTALSAAGTVRARLRNFGLQAQSGIRMGMQLDGGAWIQEILPDTLRPGAFATFVFSEKIDLSQAGKSYALKLYASAQDDQQTANDTLNALVKHLAFRDGALSSAELISGCNAPELAALQVWLRNEGLSPIDSARIRYAVNQGPPLELSKTFDAAILPGDSAAIALPAPLSQDGPNEALITLLALNAQGPDAWAGNDTLRARYDIHTDDLSVIVVVRTDAKPQETTWDIRRKSDDALLLQGGPYAQKGQLYLADRCLSPDDCYVFTVYDAGGDGIDTDGLIVLYVSDLPFFIYPNTNFGQKLSHPFCVGDTCGGLALSVASVLEPSGPTQSDGSAALAASGGQPPYEYALDGGFFQSEPVFAGLPPGDYAFVCRDAKGCIAAVSLTLTHSIATGGPVPLVGLRVWPNPLTDGLCWIEAQAGAGDERKMCEVLDAKGRLLHRFALTRWDNRLYGALSLQRYPAGVYLLRVSGHEQLIRLINP